MRVERLYFKDTFLFGTRAIITKIGKDDHGVFVRLDRTVFHPKGGGQLDDRGTIAGIPVVDVVNIKEGNEINHYISGFATPEESGLHSGQEVDLKIEEGRRLQNAALHTSGHVLAFLAERRFPNLKAYQGHHYPGESHVKFTRRDEKGEFVLPEQGPVKEALEQDFAASVRSDLPISVSDTEQFGRKVTIGGFEESQVGCGGTHLTTMSQIGMFSVRNAKKVKTYFQIGYDAAPSETLLQRSTCS
jgi:Ser-tRNA(Ala) deacylase AlaX